MNSTAGFENIDCIKFSNIRSIRTWFFWKRVIVDFVITKCVPSFQYRSVAGDVIEPIDKEGTTDFCTTPPILWWLPCFVPCRFSFSGTLHDQLYLHHAAIINGTYKEISREWADDMLCEMVEREPDPGTVAEAEAYKAGVRLFGWMYWGAGNDPKQPVGKIDISRLIPGLS